MFFFQFYIVSSRLQNQSFETGALFSLSCSGKRNILFCSLREYNVVPNLLESTIANFFLDIFSNCGNIEKCYSEHCKTFQGFDFFSKKYNYYLKKSLKKAQFHKLKHIPTNLNILQ